MEIDLLVDSSVRKATVRCSVGRGIENKLNALARDLEFFDGSRDNGYGGYRNDGRWFGVAENLIRHYKLDSHSDILVLNCEKGYLNEALRERLPGANIMGTESSDYAISCIREDLRSRIIKSSPKATPFLDKSFDLVIGLGVVYVEALGGAMTALAEIQRLSRKDSYITLANYSSVEDYFNFRKWSLLGTTILTKDEWELLMKKANFTGDYKFVNALSLGLGASENHKDAV